MFAIAWNDAQFGVCFKPCSDYGTAVDEAKKWYNRGYKVTIMQYCEDMETYIKFCSYKEKKK